MLLLEKPDDKIQDDIEINKYGKKIKKVEGIQKRMKYMKVIQVIHEKKTEKETESRH